MYMTAFFFVLPLVLARGHIVLVSLPLYTPFRDYSIPVTYIGKVVPSDYPWPDRIDGHYYPSQTHFLTNIPSRVKDDGFLWSNPDSSISTSNSNQENLSNKPVTLEYKPMRPFHHPKPGNTLTQIIPPGKPWPSEAESYQTSTQSSPNLENKMKDEKPSIQETSSQEGFLWESEDVTTKQPVNLEYQPMRPPLHPNPGSNVGQIIPPGQPWPANPEDYPNITQSSTPPNLEDRNKESEITSKNPSTTQINLEYQPSRPPFHPNPGDTLGQIIPPGNPWPSKPEDYQNFTQTSPDLENKMKDESTSQSGFTWDVTTKKPISLEYQPMRPPLHPNPGNNIGQIIPPGKPWPASPEDYPNAQTPPNLEDRNKESEASSKKPVQMEESTSSTSINLEYQPNRPSFHPNPGSNLGQIIPPGKPWPDSLEGYQNSSRPGSTINLVDRNKDTIPSTPTNIGEISPPANQNFSDTNVVQQQKPISLEYEPNRPFFHPKPGSTLGQIIPPGQPWPDTPEGYQNFSQVTSPTINLVNRGQEDEQPATSPPTQEPTPLNLGYKPTRPFYHPNPGSTLGQIIPPGKPWPDSPEGYQNFGQMSSPKPSLVDRIKEDAPSTTSTTRQKQTPPSLEYKPTRPFYHPNPGNNLEQIVPPGKPWPNSEAGYQTSLKPDLSDRIKEDEPTTVRNTPKQTPLSLGYKPTRPFYLPNPGVTIGQIVSPGKPWPNSEEGYQTSLKPDLSDRLKEDEPTTVRNTPKQTPLSLGYKPTRPFYLPNPGVTLSQIVPPGKPWPANPEGYRDAPQVVALSDRVKSATTQSGFIRKTETSSELGQNENKPQETSTIHQALESTTEGRLYTSALAEEEAANKKETISPTSTKRSRKGYGKRNSPFVLMPLNLLPSHRDVAFDV